VLFGKAHFEYSEPSHEHIIKSLCNLYVSVAEFYYNLQQFKIDILATMLYTYIMFVIIQLSQITG